MTYVIPQVNAASDTFQIWLDRTNQSLDVLAHQAMTANTSAGGGYTKGNAYLEGIFGSLVLAARSIHGGNTSASSDLFISSNAYLGNTDHGIFLNSNGVLVTTDGVSVGNSSVNTAITPSRIQLGGSADRLSINTTAISGTNFHFVSNTDALRTYSNGTLMGTRGGLNFIGGNNVSISAVDNAASGSVDLTFTALGGGSGNGAGISSITQPNTSTMQINLTDGSSYVVNLYPGIVGKGIQSVTVISAGKVRITYTDASTQDLTFPGAGAITSNTTFDLVTNFGGNLETAVAFFKTVVITPPAVVTLKLPAETRTFTDVYDFGGLERVVLQGDTSGFQTTTRTANITSTIHSSGVYWATIPVSNSAGFHAGDIVNIDIANGGGGGGSWYAYLGPRRVVAVANSTTITVAVRTNIPGPLPNGNFVGGVVKKSTTIWKTTGSGVIGVGGGSRLGGFSDITLDGSSTSDLGLIVNGEVLGLASADANTNGTIGAIDYAGPAAVEVFGNGSRYRGGVAVTGAVNQSGIQVGGEAYLTKCIINFCGTVGIYVIFGGKLTLAGTYICNNGTTGLACGMGSRAITAGNTIGGPDCTILGNPIDVLADTLGFVYGGGLEKTGISVSPAFDTFSASGAYIAST
jgi:hypothetical protein